MTDLDSTATGGGPSATSGAPSTVVLTEGLLARTFDAWRAEFRTILEDHRREIHQRLEQIEREIEKKSDKDHVDVIVRSIREDLRRHAEDIKNLNTALADKVGADTIWKIVGLVLTVGSIVGAIVGFVVRTMAR